MSDDFFLLHPLLFPDAPPNDRTLLIKQSELREMLETQRRECGDPVCECHPWFAGWRREQEKHR